MNVVHRTARLALAALALAGLCSCDLAHADQKRFCSSARNDYAKCASRPDWCIPYGGPECVASVEGANCSDCQPAGAAEGSACSPKPSLDCSRETPRLQNGVFKPLGTWDWKSLDRAVLGPKEGKPLTAEDVQAVSEHDRRVVCGPGRGGDWTGKSPCVLEWSAEAGKARCVLDEKFCATSCRTHLTNFQCISKNLCSGVICP